MMVVLAVVVMVAVVVMIVMTEVVVMMTAAMVAMMVMMMGMVPGEQVMGLPRQSIPEKVKNKSVHLFFFVLLMSSASASKPPFQTRSLFKIRARVTNAQHIIL